MCEERASDVSGATAAESSSSTSSLPSSETASPLLLFAALALPLERPRSWTV